MFVIVFFNIFIYICFVSVEYIKEIVFCVYVVFILYNLFFFNLLMMKVDFFGLE